MREEQVLMYDYLYEKQRAEQERNLQHEMKRRQMLAGMPRQRRSMVRQVCGGLGILLVALGTRLEHVESDGKQAAYNP